MSRVWQMFATFTLVAALAVSGHAGPGNGNGGEKGKGNGNGKPDKVQKDKSGKGKKPKPDKADKQAEKDARKAEKDALKELRKAEKEAQKALKQAEKEARKAAKNAGTDNSFRIGQVIITDGRIVDLTGDYLLEAEIIEGDGTVLETSTALSLVQDSRGQLVGTALVTFPDGREVEVPVVGEMDSSDGVLTLHLEGALPDDSASIHIDGTYDGTAFQSDVTVTDLELEYTYPAVLVPSNTVVGFVIEAPTSEQIIDNKVWSDRTVVLPWGTEVVRSQLMNKKGFKFMMHSDTFGIDLRGTVNDAGEVTLSRAKLHLAYGDIWLDPATVEIIPVVE